MQIGLFDRENRIDRCAAQLEAAHIIIRTGTIVDATFMDAPRQRNTRDDYFCDVNIIYCQFLRRDDDG